MSFLVLGFALVAVVLLVASLASGIIERAPLSYPMIFLGLGFLLASPAIGVLHMDAHNPLLEGVAIVCLSLVLFLDAVKLDVDELRGDWLIPMLSLGPGTLLSIGGIAVAAYGLMNVGAMESVLLGAILASTDPVVLRDVVRDQRIPRSVRRALGVEAGMNDIVVLPIVLILIAILGAELGGVVDWLVFLGRLLILSPLVGLIVGGCGAWLMGKADARWNIRREYQALYGIGLVLAAYAAGQAVFGDGFLAAFFAGLAVNIFNVSLCDCFLEYGEVTAEMAMLLAFVLFGAVLSTLLPTLPLVVVLMFALLVLVVIRPVALGLVLRKAAMSNLGRAFIGWFGPRGLSSLLLVLLAVQADIPNAEYLLAITGMVVVLSVVLHGASATPLAAWYGQRVAASHITMAEEREATATGLFQPDAVETPRTTVAQLAEQLASPHPPVVLDLRSRAHYDEEEGQIPGSVRVLPDHVDEWAETASRDQPIVAYCSCPNDATSARAARFLRGEGFDASALAGGYHAWRDAYPVEPKMMHAA